MNKALDLNKTTKKPLDQYYMARKLDGHYTEVIKDAGTTTYYTSSHLTYRPEQPTWLDDPRLPDGVYICERVVGAGLLGTRRRCSLRGKKDDKVAPANHRYKVHDYLTIDEYHDPEMHTPYSKRRERLHLILAKYAPFEEALIPDVLLPFTEAGDMLDFYTLHGFEGIVLKHPDWVWRNTSKRSVHFMKWKERPTVDLLVVDTTEGEGKYAGKIGALVLKDKVGRTVKVGSGLTDDDRSKPREYWVGKVVEIEYEQILDTYIQPTFLHIRDDKTEGE